MVSYWKTSVALILKPTIGRVSPQYHAEFDDDFTNSTHMKDGTILPVWEDLVKYSAKRATATDFLVIKSWLAGLIGEAASDQLSGLYVIVSDQPKRQ